MNVYYSIIPDKNYYLENDEHLKIDYNKVQGIRLEARQKLEKFRPNSIGQASRISGVSPADINVLLIYLNLENSK